MTTPRYALVPRPRSITEFAGEMPITSSTRIAFADPAAEPVARRLSSSLGLPFGRGPGSIDLVLDRAVAHDEGYVLEVAPERAVLRARTLRGLGHAASTLRQLLPPGPAVSARIPAVRIEDAPRFAYRGVMLDVARHFFDCALLEKYVELLAMYKMNVLHLHLTDDQGWRIEIKKHPRLTEIGAWRKETLIGHADKKPYRYDGTRHGGFYPQAELRDLVRFAAERGVTLVPEIDLPGHALAALASYPELGCGQGPFEVSPRWGILDPIYCPREETFRFLGDVLAEVMDVFPGPYVHVGGDEAVKTRWKSCDVARALMKREGLGDVEQLQAYFIGRMSTFVRARGRRLIGWDEILEGGLVPDAVVMSWRGVDGGVRAVEQGHEVVMSPHTHCYLDHYQADPDNEPLAIGGHTPVSQVYAFEPIVPGIEAAREKLVLGAQVNLWTEYVPTSEHLEYMLCPRMQALAEVVWSPREARSWDDFVLRLRGNAPHLSAHGVSFARHVLPG
jgi:hexosaminidase